MSHQSDHTVLANRCRIGRSHSVAQRDNRNCLTTASAVPRKGELNYGVSTVNLKGNDSSTSDFSRRSSSSLLDLAAELKAAKRNGTEEQQLKQKEIVLIFEKSSTRTRCAFEVAAYDQGAHVTYLDLRDRRSATRNR